MKIERDKVAHIIGGLVVIATLAALLFIDRRCDHGARRLLRKRLLSAWAWSCTRSCVTRSQGRVERLTATKHVNTARRQSSSRCAEAASGGCAPPPE